MDLFIHLCPPSPLPLSLLSPSTPLLSTYIGPSPEHSATGPHKITDKLFANTRYFVIKSNNFENVEIAKDKVGVLWCDVIVLLGCGWRSEIGAWFLLFLQSVWSTPPYNEKKLNKAYRVSGAGKNSC